MSKTRFKMSIKTWKIFDTLCATGHTRNSVVEVFLNQIYSEQSFKGFLFREASSKSILCSLLRFDTFLEEHFNFLEIRLPKSLSFLRQVNSGTLRLLKKAKYLRY